MVAEPAVWGDQSDHDLQLQHRQDAEGPDGAARHEGDGVGSGELPVPEQSQGQQRGFQTSLAAMEQASGEYGDRGGGDGDGRGCGAGAPINAQVRPTSTTPVTTAPTPSRRCAGALSCSQVTQAVARPGGTR
jgi:hypothetical protein